MVSKSHAKIVKKCQHIQITKTRSKRKVKGNVSKLVYLHLRYFEISLHDYVNYYLIAYFFFHVGVSISNVNNQFVIIM